MDYTAGIFLLNGQNEILLVHPTNARWNTWSIPKGLPDEGETILEAAKRELFEETNVDINKLQLVYLYDKIKPVLYASKKKTLCPIFCKVVKDLDTLELKCNSLVEGANFYENDKIEWVGYERALTLIHESQVRAWKEFIMTSLR